MKKVMLTAFLLVFLLGLTSATNGCNLQDPDCSNGLVDNCDVRSDLIFKEMTHFDLYDGIDICVDNPKIINLSLKEIEGDNGYNVGIYSEGYDYNLQNLQIEGFTIGIWSLENYPRLFNVTSESKEAAGFFESLTGANIQNSSFGGGSDVSLAVWGDGRLDYSKGDDFIIENNYIWGSINDCLSLESLPSKKTSIRYNTIDGNCDKLIKGRHLNEVDIEENYLMNGKTGVYLSSYSTGNKIVANYFINVTKPAYEHFESKENNWNDSTKGNYYDNLEFFNNPTTQRSTKSTLFSPFYKVGGDYDGVDYKPRLILEDIDNLEDKRIELNQVLDEIPFEGRDLKVSEKLRDSLNEVNFDNPTKEDINSLKKAYTYSTRLKSEYSFYVQNQIISLIRQVAKDKLDYSSVTDEVLENARDKFYDAEDLYQKGYLNRAVDKYKKSFVILERF